MRSIKPDEAPRISATTKTADLQEVGPSAKGLHLARVIGVGIIEGGTPSGPAGAEGEHQEITALHIDFVRVYFDGPRIVGIGVEPLVGGAISAIGRQTSKFQDVSVGKDNVMSELWVNIENDFQPGKGYIAGLRTDVENAHFSGQFDGVVQTVKERGELTHLRAPRFDPPGRHAR